MSAVEVLRVTARAWGLALVLAGSAAGDDARDEVRDPVTQVTDAATARSPLDNGTDERSA